MGQDKQELIVHVVGVDAQFGVAGVRSISTSDDDGLLFADVKLNDSRVIVKDVDVTQIDLEIGDREFILMEEGTVHDSNGPWLHGVVHRNDLGVGVITMSFVNVFCEMGPDEVVVAVFCVEGDLPMTDCGEPHIEFVLDFPYSLFRGGVDIVEVVVKTDPQLGSVRTIHQDDHLDSEPDSIEALDGSIVLQDDFVGEVGNLT